MFKTSIFPILDLAFQMASFGFPDLKLVLQNKQIGIPKNTIEEDPYYVVYLLY